MANTLTTITDANGKEISVDFSHIADINGDVGAGFSGSDGILDSRKNRVSQIHDIEIVDTNGKILDREQLLADMASGSTNISALDVEMEATHSGPNHNYCIYYEDSMEKDCESFVNPFKKPILKNHNAESGEPLGRIQQSWYGPSALTDERSAIHLKARVTDKDAFAKFIDGRYGTVSIGGSMGTVTCNICGKTILKDGKFKFCGHWRGETYKDQTCFWGAKDIEYHEVSTVNNPADDFAQIMKVTVVTDKKQKEEGSDMDGQSNNQTTQASSAEEVKKSVCDMIDQLLGKTSTEQPVSDSQTENNTTEPSADNTQQSDTADSNNNDDLNQKLQKAEADLADANKKLGEVEAELQTTKDALNKANSDLEAAKTEAEGLKDMCLTLATSNKEMVIDQILAKEKSSKALAEDKVEERKNELLAQSMKDLNKMLSDSTTPSIPRNPVIVQNPTLADTSRDSGTNDNMNSNVTDSKEARNTVDDYARAIISKLFK